jgi:hypothetical protein
MLAVSGVDLDPIAERLAQWQQLKERERLSPPDFPSAWTERETYLHELQLLRHRSWRLRSLGDERKRLQTQQDTDSRLRDLLTEARDEFAAELLATQSPAVGTALSFDLLLIDRGLGGAPLPVVTLAPTRLGAKMAAAGFPVTMPELLVFRPLGELERRIEERTAHLAVVEQEIEGLLAVR